MCRASSPTSLRAARCGIRRGSGPAAHAASAVASQGVGAGTRRTAANSPRELGRLDVDVVPRQYPGACAASPMRVSASARAARQSIIARARAVSTSPAGTSQPLSPPLHQLGNAGDEGGDHRPAQRHRLHDDDRRGPRRARQHQAPERRGSRRAPGRWRSASVMRTCRTQAEPVDQRLDLGTHLAVAGEHQLERPAGGDDPLCFATSSSWPFCSHGARRTPAAPPPGLPAARRDGRPARGRSARPRTLGQSDRREPAQRLAAAEGADGDDEGRRRPFSPRPRATGLSNSSGP